MFLSNGSQLCVPIRPLALTVTWVEKEGGEGREKKGSAERGWGKRVEGEKGGGGSYMERICE